MKLFVLPKLIGFFVFAFIAFTAIAQEDQSGDFKPIKSFSFEIGGARFVIPKRIVIERGKSKVFSDAKAEVWNGVTDGVRYFKFGEHIFLIVSQWDTADYITFRLFHLEAAKDEVKEYKIMGANEADFAAGFFVDENKLYYWEQRFCQDKKAYVFEQKNLAFQEIHFRELKEGTCLPKNLAAAQKQHKIKETPANEAK